MFYRLPKPVRILLDVLGLVVSLCGVALTFVNEYYVVGSLLTLLFGFMTVLLVQHIRVRDFRFHTLRHYVEIKDAKGEEAIWRKETSATPLLPNIRIWQDHEFHSSGGLTYESSNIGELIPPDPQGGAESLKTVFEAPLRPGHKITKVLTIRCSNCFTEPTESITWIPMHDFDELAFHITLPPERPCHGAPRAFCYTGTSSEELDNAEAEEGGTTLHLVIQKPKRAAKYALVWDW